MIATLVGIQEWTESRISTIQVSSDSVAKREGNLPSDLKSKCSKCPQEMIQFGLLETCIPSEDSNYDSKRCAYLSSKGGVRRLYSFCWALDSRKVGE